MHIHTAYACNVRPQCCVYSQETGRHASTLTLKWRHRGSGWGRSSSSCPMPTPLLNPQLDNPSQVSLLGTTLTNLLKKNISEPFQLTLLNVGVTNFVGAKGVSAGGWFISATRSLFFTLKSCASSPIVCPSFALPLFTLLPSIFFFFSSTFLAHISLAIFVLVHMAHPRCLAHPCSIPSSSLRRTAPPR